MSRDRIIQLQERAEDLGFNTIQDALDAGYHEVQDLVAGTFKLEKIDNMVEQEKAHEAWLEEKEAVLADLRELLNGYLPTGEQDEIKALERAIDFVEGCHD